MRSQTRWLQRIVRVFTLTSGLLSIPADKSFAQVSLFDPAFNAGHGANGIVYGIVVQDDGKIVVGGEFTQIAGQARTNLARLNSDGQLDALFPQGTDGAVYRLLKQPDGKILVGGTFTNLQGVVRQRIGRILTNGVVDSGFDTGTNIASELAVIALACQPDGKVLASSFDPTALNLSFLNRFNPDGQLDTIFVQTNVFQGWLARAICPRTNGPILIGGAFRTVNAVASPGLALISTNGELDANFISPILSGADSGLYSDIFLVESLPDNSVLLGGRFWQKDTTNRFAVAKLTPALAWDSGFNPDIFDPFSGQTTLGVANTAIQQPDGKFVIGGLFQEVGGYWRRNIVRLDAQGKVDPCFEPGFGIGDYVGWGGAIGVHVVARQTDGKILAGGNFVNFMGSPVATLSSSNLTRFLPQNDCNATRVHLGFDSSYGRFVVGTCTPGGTNYLQSSTNLVDWSDLVTGGVFGTIGTTSPYLTLSGISTNEGALFFRVRKEY